VSTRDKPSDPIEISIGTLSSATGVPIETLRTWERRYGFPVPTTRTGGSHRRYAAETIDQIRLIARAIEAGHRPSAVVGRDLEELRRLMDAPVLGAPVTGPNAAADRLALARWIDLTERMDGEGLVAEFRRSLSEMAVVDFLARRMSPYISVLGREWANGALRVSHEHFASEKAREFLSVQWRDANQSPRGNLATVVLATPPGERHVLGLLMAAWVIALAGVHVIFLGADTPMEEVAFAVEYHSARGVALSVAAGYAGDLRGALSDLALRVPRTVAVVVGGEGSENAPLELKMNRFDDLFQWAIGLAEDGAVESDRLPGA
jgi:MerR family transcriptional regulator, light-induced transcriptional regulator